MENILNIILGIGGIVIAVFIIVYAKMFIAKIFNVNVVDRNGRPLYDAESFDNVNASIKEKIIPAKSYGNSTTVKENKISGNLEDYDVPMKSSDLKRLMQERTIISLDLVGKSCYFTIDRISTESNFINKAGEKICHSNPPHNPLMKKTIFCISNSNVEMQKVENKNLLVKGLKFEKEGDFEMASLIYKEYLNKVQFRFTLISKNNIYPLIKVGDIIIGMIDTYTTANGIFLTVDSSTIHYKR